VRRVVAIIAAVASGAIAAPASSPPAATWADWVGAWSGKLAWSNCATSGAASATLALDAVDGALDVDLAPAGAALGRFSLVEDDRGLSAQHADVAVHVDRRRGAPGLDLAVRFDSGCTLRAQLARPASGIPACDELEAWTRIESRCTKLSGKPLEDATAIARERDGWLKARGAVRGKLAEQCVARAGKVEAELVGAGCAPNRDPYHGVRAKDCLALVDAANRLARCVPQSTEARELATEGSMLSAAAETADTASLPVVERQCRDAHQKVSALATRFSCL
jgi:hypothetical protein